MSCVEDAKCSAPTLEPVERLDGGPDSIGDSLGALKASVANLRQVDRDGAHHIVIAGIEEALVRIDEELSSLGLFR